MKKILILATAMAFASICSPPTSLGHTTETEPAVTLSNYTHTPVFAAAPGFSYEANAYCPQANPEDITTTETAIVPASASVGNSNLTGTRADLTITCANLPYDHGPRNW